MSHFLKLKLNVNPQIKIVCNIQDWCNIECRRVGETIEYMYSRILEYY